MPKAVEAEDGDPIDVIGYMEPPELTETSTKLVNLFTRCQKEDVSTSKAVKEFRKLFDSIKDPKERKLFVKHLQFMLQVPLVNGTCKERPNKYDEKIFEVVCRFSASFVIDAIASKKKEGEDGEEIVELEVPWVMKKLFSWLLDRHEVTRLISVFAFILVFDWNRVHFVEESQYWLLLSTFAIVNILIYPQQTAFGLSLCSLSAVIGSK